MKKLLYLFIIMIVLFFAGLNHAFADTYESNINSDNIIIKKTLDNGVLEIKSISVFKFNDSEYFKIREMTDACGASVEWVAETKSIKVNCNDSIMLFKYNSNDIYVNGISYNFGKPVLITEGVSYAPVEIYKAFTGELRSNEVINVISENKVENENNSMITVEKGIESDRITFWVNPEKIKSNFKLNNPSRIVIDINNIDFSGELPEGSTFKQIRYSNYSGVTRFVFDLSDDYKYQLNANGNSFIVDISTNGQFISDTSKIEVKNNNVIINTGNYSGYTVSRTSDPFAINIFLPDILTGTISEILPDDSLIEKVIAAPFENGTKISVVTFEQCAFELEKLAESFIIGIYDPVVKNLEYHNESEIPYIDLTGSMINSSSKPIIEYKTNGTYLTFNATDNALTDGQIYINDGFIKSVFVNRNNSIATIRIDSLVKIYPVFQESEGKTVLYLHETDYSGKLVVISAGHGGRDPGAVAGDIHEADINLSIALKLNEMLERLGVDTLMIREDDTFYSLDERVDIANSNKADLFISIHSNALDDPDFDGIMTLVHSGSLNYNKINGRTAGDIIHKYLIEATGATDREVRYRDNIVVLKDTAMPAVEIEAGFLTNQAELSKLIDDTYQTLIARAATEGILEVLKYID